MARRGARVTRNSAVSRSEREKMLAGELYRASDPELAQMELRAQTLLSRYNATLRTEVDLRAALRRALFGAIGEGANIRPPFFCDYGVHIRAGRNLFMNFD